MTFEKPSIEQPQIKKKEGAKEIIEGFSEKFLKRKEKRDDFLSLGNEIREIEKDILKFPREEQEKEFKERISASAEKLKNFEGFEISPGEKIQLAQSYYRCLNISSKLHNEKPSLALFQKNPEIFKLFKETSFLLTNNIIVFDEKDLSDFELLEKKAGAKTHSENRKYYELKHKFELLLNQICYWRHFPYKNYEPFIPEIELKKIRKLSPEEQKLPKEEKRKIKQERLEAFKKQLDEQKAIIAQMQVEFMKKVEEKPDRAEEEFRFDIELYSNIFKFSPSQVNFFEKIIKECSKRHSAVEKIRKEHPEDEKLFEFLFGNIPNGKCEIIKGPIVLCFKCYNPNDFVRLRMKKFKKDEEVTPMDIEENQRVGGCKVIYREIPELRDSIIAENSSIISEEYSKELFIHELQHAINTLFKDELIRYSASQDLKEAKTPESIRRALERFMKFEREEKIDWHAKDEILAYYSQEMDLNEIFKILTRRHEERGSYDYFRRPESDNFRKTLFKTIFDSIDEKQFAITVTLTAKKVFYKDYHKQIRQCLESIAVLKKKGYPKNEIIALLLTEHPHHWSKIAKRMLTKKKVFDF